jgi:glycosyltransferase involved in cell wall biosynthesis
MRILGLTNLYPPLGYGYGAICRDVMRGLAGRGHEVRVLCAAGGEDEQAFPVERSLAHLPGAWRRPVAGLRAERPTQAAVQTELDRGVDAAIAWHMRGIGKGALTLLHRAGVPVVYALGDLWVVYERPGPPSAWAMWSRVDRLAAYRALRAAAAGALGAATSLELRPPPIAAEGRCAFASGWLRGRYAEAGFEPVHGTVVPNGIDLSSFPAEPLARETTRALFVGRADASKGADIALDAVARRPELTLTMIGGAGPEVAEQVSRLGLGDRVELVGEASREEVVRQMLEHDVFLMPGRIDEGFGLVYLEAMAAGLVVVGTATGGAAELCHHERNALVVRADADDVASAIRRLAADAPLRARLAAEGRRTAERYSLSATVDGFEALAAA